MPENYEKEFSGFLENAIPLTLDNEFNIVTQNIDEVRFLGTLLLRIKTS